MFAEYVLAPGLLTTWTSFRYCTEKFGWPQGRLLCEYPKRWKKMVYDAIRGETPMNRKRIEERLRRIDDRLIRRRDAPYDPDLAPDGSAWIKNAANRHGELPFQAIIADDWGVTGESIILGEDLDEEHPLMRLGDGVLPRDAAKFAKAARLLLQTGNTILLVDPHFKPDKKRFRVPFKALLEAAKDSPYRSGMPAVQLHTGIGKDHGNDEGKIGRRVAELKRECEHWLPKTLPDGQQVKVFIWLPRSNGEAFHNRYIMSELAGIAMGTGADQQPRTVIDQPFTQTDDWFRMTTEQHKTRWAQFQPETCPYKKLNSFNIPG